MSEKMPQKPFNTNSKTPNSEQVRELKTIQTLAIVASIAGPVSLILGGLFLNTAAFIVAFIAFYKIRKFIENNPEHVRVAKELRRTCVIAIIGCSIAFVLNVIQVAMVYPIVVEAINNGTLDNLLNGSGEPPKGSRTWG